MPGNVIQGCFPAGLTRVSTLADRGVVQRDAALQQRPNAIPLPSHVATHRPAGSGRTLPPPVLQAAEAFFGARFGDVRVHTEPYVHTLGALAVTRGTDIHFAPGQYDLGSPRGRQTLAHELAHVVQQKAGRVRNPFNTGVALVHDPALEAEAERMSMRAATLSPRTIQRFVAWCDWDHDSRGALLGLTLRESSGSLMDRLNWSRTTDTTLTVWGHGDSGKLGDYTAGRLADRLKDLGFHQTQMKTLELISCDVSNPLVATGTSYAEQVVRALTAREMGGITVKALPRGDGASKSILYFDYDHRTFDYLIFPDRDQYRAYKEWNKTGTDDEAFDKLKFEGYYDVPLSKIRRYLEVVGTSSGGGCFITTACTGAMGLTDDCALLTTLRRYRDGFLSSRPELRALVREYYAIAPPIVAAIARRDDAHEVWHSVFRSLEHAAALIEAERNEEALSAYRSLVYALSSRA